MFYKRKIEASLGTIKLFVLDIFATRETQSQKLDDEKKWPLKPFFLFSYKVVVSYELLKLSR